MKTHKSRNIIALASAGVLALGLTVGLGVASATAEAQPVESRASVTQPIPDWHTVKAWNNYIWDGPHKAVARIKGTYDPRTGVLAVETFDGTTYSGEVRMSVRVMGEAGDQLAAPMNKTMTFKNGKATANIGQHDTSVVEILGNVTGQES